MLDEDTSAMRARWISQATSLLEEGRGHLGIVNFLRAEGLKPDTAKAASYDIFDEAKKQLLRRQRPHRIIAWFFVALGIVIPLAMVVLNGRVVIASAAPVLLGMILLSRLQSPSRLPPPIRS